MNVSAPEGSRIEKTTAIVAEIEQLVQNTIPKQELEEVISNTGLYFGDAARFAPNTGNHTAFVLVNLVTGHAGKTDDYIATLRLKVRQALPGVEVSFQTGGIISDVLNFGLRAPIDIQVKGPRLDLIRPVAEEIREKVAQVANTTDVRIKQGKNYPEMHVNVDRTKAAYYGITQDRVIVDVITGISSNIALSPNYWLDPKTANGYFLLAQYPEQSLTKTEDLLNIPIIGARTPLAPTSSLTTAGASGSIVALQNTPFAGRKMELSSGFYASGDERRGPPVLLRDVATLDMKTGPDSVDHYDLSRLIDVLVTPVGNDLGRVANEIEQVLATVKLPKDVTIRHQGRSSQHARGLQQLCAGSAAGGALDLSRDGRIVSIDDRSADHPGRRAARLDRDRADAEPDQYVGECGIHDRHTDDDGHRGLEQYSAGGLRQPHGARRSDSGTSSARSREAPRETDFDDGTRDDPGATAVGARFR